MSSAEKKPEPVHVFSAELIAGARGGVGIEVPFDVYGIYATRGRVKIAATVDGVAYRGSIVPMGGRHVMGVKREIRDAIGKGVGDTVAIVMQRDLEPRTMEIPDDLQAALKQVAGAWETFEKFAYTHKKEYVQWITSAKKPETRTRRLVKAVEMISGGKKLS